MIVIFSLPFTFPRIRRPEWPRPILLKFSAPSATSAALDFMHLRHTAVARLAEAGCELAEIAAITGHTLTSCAQIIDRYLVRTERLAERAFRRRMDAERPR